MIVHQDMVMGGTFLILLANSVLGHVIPAKAGIQRPAKMRYVYMEDLYDELIG